MRIRNHFGLVMIVVLKTFPKNFLSLFKRDLKEKFIHKAESDLSHQKAICSAVKN